MSNARSRSKTRPTGTAAATAAPASSLGPQEMIRLWDRGSKQQRLSILAAVLARHRNATAAEIERDFGHSAMLFFTRITAWLRLTYQLQTELSLQLSVLSLFLQGQRFLTNFMEVGGIQVLTDLVCLTNDARRTDKQQALLILVHVANAGRVYREMICDGDGIKMLVEATRNEQDEKTLEFLGSLFLALGHGNPRKSAAVHSGLLMIMRTGCDDGALCAATTLRSLQLSKQAYADGPGTAMFSIGGEGSPNGKGPAQQQQEDNSGPVLDAFFHLLQAVNVKLRFEGMELLTMAAHNHALLGPVVRRCVETLESADMAFDTDPEALRPAERLKASCGRVLCNIVQSSSMPDAAAEHVLVLLDRYSAHLTLGKYLRACAGRDIPGQMDCCKALRKMVYGPYVNALNKPINTVVTENVSRWLKESLSPALYDTLLRSEDVDDQLSFAVAEALMAHDAKELEALRRREEQGDEENDDDVAGDQQPFGAAPPPAAQQQEEENEHPEDEEDAA